MTHRLAHWAWTLAVLAATCRPGWAAEDRVMLDRGWRIQSSANVEVNGMTVSKPGLDTRTGPSTAALPKTTLRATLGARIPRASR